MVLFCQTRGPDHHDALGGESQVLLQTQYILTFVTWCHF